MSDVVRYPDVAPPRDCHLGCCDLLERGIIYYGKHEAAPMSGRNDRISRNFRQVEALAPDPSWGFFWAASNWRELGVVRSIMTRECDERMWNLAYRLAHSGEHQNHQAIEWELAACGFRRARQLLDHERVREKLDGVCA